MYTVGRSAPRRFSPVGSLSHFRRQAQLPRFFQRQVRRAYSRSPPRISADSDPTPWPARPTRFSATGNPGGHERPALRLSVDPPFVSRHRRRRVGAVRRLLAGGHLHEREERRRRPEGRTGPVLCQMCKRPPAPKPTPAGFDWWRKHFSDTELPELGSGAMELTDAEAAALQGPSMPSPLEGSAGKPVSTSSVTCVCAIWLVAEVEAKKSSTAAGTTPARPARRQPSARDQSFRGCRRGACAS
jgi:hypothetical protein